MDKLINLGILAHVDAGKTTLTEKLLLLSGAIRQAGSVDEGTAHTDALQVERARGISVVACSAQIQYNGVRVNLIDTPGHVDFSGEIERSLRALDNAVLILSAVEGVQPQTEAIWKALNALRIPVLFFINKTDRIGADVAQTVAQIKQRFNVTPIELEGFPPKALLKTAILEALAENDLNFMEEYLNADNALAFSDERILSLLSAQYANRQLFPLMQGAAAKDIGVEPLLTLLTAIGKPAEIKSEGELSGVVYRIQHHPSQGRLAHIRLFNGQMENRQTVYNATKNLSEKVTQIKQYAGIRLQDTGKLVGGEIGVVCGLSESSIGDIYGSPAYVPDGYAMTQPLIGVRVFPADESQYPPLLEATQELYAEDPLLNMVWVKEQRSLLLTITGMIQLEILETLYLTRFGLSVSFGTPTVIYKETPAAVGEGFEAYTMPKPCWAIIRFLIKPLPLGTGIVYESKIGPDALPLRYQAQIAQALPDALKQGPKGWEITDAHISLIAGESHVYHTHPLDFITTTPMALLNGLVNTGTLLLEPMLRFTLSVPEEYSGKILGEMAVMRGRYDETEIHNHIFTLRGVYPLATGMDFPQRIAALTSGKGILNAEFYRYEPCPPGFTATQPYRGVSPLDRAKYILHIRGAL